MTRAIRLVYDVHPRTIGGTERFLARFLPRLDPSRFEPLVVSSRRGAPLRLISSIGIRTACVPEFFQKRGVGRLAALMRRHDVRLAQSNYYSSQLALAAGLAAVPHVWRLGGHVEFGSAARWREDIGTILELIRTLSHEIVCNSRYVRSQFGSGRVPPPIGVIPNGVERVEPGHAESRRGPFRVAMVAHFTRQKRHDDFVRAAEIVCGAHADVRFTIFGQAYGDADSRRYAAEIRRLAGPLEARGQLRFSRFAAHDRSSLGAHDALVLPTIGESASNAVLEAMAAGIPVVAARSGGTPELVVHGHTGLLVPIKRPEAIARALLRLMANRTETSAMGHAARRRAHTTFSLDRCVRRYEALYRRVLRHARAE
jgi:glycosyltransferase involved in cell wall biosynthesis